MHQKILKTFALTLPPIGIGLLLSSCSTSTAPLSRAQGPEFSDRADSGFDFLTYMEPQDSFEFVAGRLNRSLKDNQVRLSKDDILAINNFCAGVSVEGFAPQLQKGRCNQLTAVLQAVLCCMEDPKNAMPYLHGRDITGFYDLAFEKAIISFLESRNCFRAAQLVGTSGIIEPEIVRELFSSAQDKSKIVF